MKTKIYVVSSTHWDREWYSAFETYRGRLVRFVDELIDILENVKEYRCFHFDGQTIVLEDYLKIRPENKDRITKLVKDGRILLGPWYTMPDEFLISGEGLVRNLSRGDNICAALEVETNKEGYVCDIFGHNSQMPQIFSGFNIDNVALFRGRKGYEKDNFMWKGADGTKTIVHKMHPDYAYSSFYFVVRWPFEEKPYEEKELVARMKKYLDEEKANFATNCHLMMDGVDHCDPERDLHKILETLNKNLPDYEFIHSNFEDYTAQIRAKQSVLEMFEGVLYELGAEGINDALLKNVLSSQVHIKQANDYSESNLTLVAEPLDFYYNLKKSELKGARNMAPYGGFLEEAWDYVLKNQPHDSICGCSITATHEDNVNRFKHVEEILNVVTSDIYNSLGQNISVKGKGKDGAFVVFNNSQTVVSGVNEIVLPILCGSHQWSFKFYDESGNLLPYNIVDSKTVIERDAQFKKLILFPGYDYITLALPVNIPAYSNQVFSYDILKMERTNTERYWPFDRFDEPQRNLGSMRTAINVVDNGALKIQFNSNGTLNILDKATGKQYKNMLTIEDCADVGDGWNYIKPMFDGEFNSLGCNANIIFEQDCPSYARVKIELFIKLPKKIDGLKRSECEKEQKIVTTVVILKDCKKISVKTESENSCVNHRVRVMFPTEFKTKTFKTLLPYDMYEWDIKKEDTSHTKEADTFVVPNQGAISISGDGSMFNVYNKGLYEVSVLERDDTPVFLTLFRSFTNEVGEVAGKMGRMEMKVCTEYMLDFENISASEAVKRANSFKVGLHTARASVGEKQISGGENIVNISGGAVISALQWSVNLRGKCYNIVRIYDVDGGASGEISFVKPVKSCTEIDFVGNVKDSAVKLTGGKICYKLAKKQIKTFAFEI